MKITIICLSLSVVILAFCVFRVTDELHDLSTRFHLYKDYVARQRETQDIQFSELETRITRLTERVENIEGMEGLSDDR